MVLMVGCCASKKKPVLADGSIYLKIEKSDTCLLKKQAGLPFYFHPETRGENRNALQDVFWLPAGSSGFSLRFLRFFHFLRFLRFFLTLLTLLALLTLLSYASRNILPGVKPQWILPPFHAGHSSASATDLHRVPFPEGVL